MTQIERHLRRRARSLFTSAGPATGSCTRMRSDRGAGCRLGDADFVDPALDDRRLCSTALSMPRRGRPRSAQAELAFDSRRSRYPAAMRRSQRPSRSRRGRAGLPRRRALPLVGKPDDDLAVGHSDIDAGIAACARRFARRRRSRRVVSRATAARRPRARDGTRLEIEAERDLRRGQPVRQEAQLIAGEEVGRCDRQR